ncbi:MAG: DUF4405 domain-containing protein [Deltaproteobacteria bacterium]|jgi:hypothetical protein
MKRKSILKTLNPVLAILFLNQILTGIFHDAIPKGAYEFLHEGGGILFAAGVVLHVILNWSWIKVNFYRKNPKG